MADSLGAWSEPAALAVWDVANVVRRIEFNGIRENRLQYVVGGDSPLRAKEAWQADR